MRVIEFILLFSAFVSHHAFAQTSGCTDPLATNYNASATVNDGSCVYAPTTVSASSSVDLDNAMAETSGLLRFNNFIWTHNDNIDVNLYAIDTMNGSIAQTCALTNVINIDWEEIQQDSNFIYIGDFGNNQNGNRTDLRILRVEKQNLCTNALVDTIVFAYEDQTDFTPTGSENTDFDCETFIVTQDSIYLFTKQWLSLQTTVYALAKTPGNHIAIKRSTYDIDGLVTGAAFIDNGLITLCGYSSLLQPFVFLLYDYTEHEFFSGNKRKLALNLPFHQVESIATTDGMRFQLTNEAFSPVPIPAKYHNLDLQPYTTNFLSLRELELQNFSFYPNPVSQLLYVQIENGLVDKTFVVVDAIGRTVFKGKLNANKSSIDVSSLSTGIYILVFNGVRTKFAKE